MDIVVNDVKFTLGTRLGHGRDASAYLCGEEVIVLTKDHDITRQAMMRLCNKSRHFPHTEYIGEIRRGTRAHRHAWRQEKVERITTGSAHARTGQTIKRAWDLCLSNVRQKRISHSDRWLAEIEEFRDIIPKLDIKYTLKDALLLLCTEAENFGYNNASLEPCRRNLGVARNELILRDVIYKIL